jgi:hypothetical protein
MQGLLNYNTTLNSSILMLLFVTGFQAGRWAQVIFIGGLASPFVSIGDPKSIVLTNQRALIQKASPNPEHEPQFGYTNPHSDAHGCALYLQSGDLPYTL